MGHASPPPRIRMTFIRLRSEDGSLWRLQEQFIPVVEVDVAIVWLVLKPSAPFPRMVSSRAEFFRRTYFHTLSQL